MIIYEKDIDTILSAIASHPSRDAGGYEVPLITDCGFSISNTGVGISWNSIEYQLAIFEDIIPEKSNLDEIKRGSKIGRALQNIFRMGREGILPYSILEYVTEITCHETIEFDPSGSTLSKSLAYIGYFLNMESKIGTTANDISLISAQIPFVCAGAFPIALSLEFANKWNSATDIKSKLRLFIPEVAVSLYGLIRLLNGGINEYAPKDEHIRAERVAKRILDSFQRHVFPAS